jgi:hypothetical protein
MPDVVDRAEALIILQLPVPVCGLSLRPGAALGQRQAGKVHQERGLSEATKEASQAEKLIQRQPENCAARGWTLRRCCNSAETVTADVNVTLSAPDQIHVPFDHSSFDRASSPAPPLTTLPSLLQARVRSLT